MLIITLMVAWLKVESLEESTDSSASIIDEDEENKYTKGAEFKDTKVPERQRDDQGCGDRTKVSVKNPIITVGKKRVVTTVKSINSISTHSTTSWEGYPIESFINRTSSQKLWNRVSVADDAALKILPPSSTNPSFRVY